MKQKSINSILEISQQINDQYIEDGKPNKSKSKIPKLIIAIIIVFVISIALGLSNKWYFKSEFLSTLSIALLIISQILVIIQTFKSMLSPVLKILKKSPYTTMLKNIKDTATVDNKYLEKLKVNSLESLEFMQNQFKTETRRLNGVSTILLGSIEKIGFFPSLIASIVTYYKLENIQSDWVFITIFSYPAVYFMMMVFNQDTVRLERMITLLDFAIKSKK